MTWDCNLADGHAAAPACAPHRFLAGHKTAAPGIDRLCRLSTSCTAGIHWRRSGQHKPRDRKGNSLAEGTFGDHCPGGGARLRVYVATLGTMVTSSTGTGGLLALANRPNKQ